VGLALLSDGPAADTISGTPTATGTFTLTVQVTDSSQKNTATAAYTLTVNQALAIMPTNLTLPPGIVGGSYPQTTFSATGGDNTGTPPYTWSITGLPMGLAPSATGVVSGTPTTATGSPFTVSVTVTDSSGNTASQTYSLTIYPPLSITPTALPPGTELVAYPQNSQTTLTGVGGSGPSYTFIVVSGTALSSVGLSLSTAGVISGTPDATETDALFTVQVTDSARDTATQSYSLTINAATSAPAQVTDMETITVSDTETFPDVVDSEPVTVTDTVSVTTGPIITATSPLPPGIEGVPYTAITFEASGGTSPYKWAAAGLPSGLNISTGGVLSGTPTVSGTTSVNVMVTDSAGLSFSADFSLTIAPPAPIASLSTTLLVFAPQVKGTTSPAQTVTLSNTGSAALNITGTGMGISILGANAADFAQVSPSCGSSVAAGGSCMISVTFTPSSTGAETATLNVADNASGTPQQVGLTGTALPPASVTCTIPTVTFSGDTATAQITCTATDFTGSVALVCNLPTQPSQFSNYTCGFSPSSLNFSSSSTASATLTIQPAAGAFLERRPLPGRASPGAVAFGAVLWLPAWAFVMRRKKGSPKRGISKRGILFLLILSCGLPLITSCVGKSGPATPPAGTYQGSMVLTGPGLNETITFSIQVQ
jgi:hypothetical protein